MANEPEHPRWIVKDQNLRDLGGLPSGRSRIVEGHLYRSGSWFDLTVADINAIQARASIRTMLDLRTSGEVERQGTGPVGEPLVEPPIDRHWVPMFAEGPAWWAQGTPSATALGKAGRYLEMLELSTAGIHQIFEFLADPARYPIVVHCFAGKDRTALLTALVLEVAGVEREYIARDWLATSEAVPEVPLGAEEVNLYLDMFARRHVSAEAFLTMACAVPESQLRQVRALLVAESGAP